MSIDKKTYSNPMCIEDYTNPGRPALHDILTSLSVRANYWVLCRGKQSSDPLFSEPGVTERLTFGWSHGAETE